MIRPRDYQEALGQAIRERRESMEMSREKLGRITGKDADYISSVENGDYAKLNLHELLVIVRVLDLRLSVLFAIVEFRLFGD
ncbi:MAG: helix-turn-helix domain-containing protein [Armatimonadota bacterium]